MHLSKFNNKRKCCKNTKDAVINNQKTSARSSAYAEIAWHASCWHMPLKWVSDTHTHTTILLLVWNMSGSTRVSRYQKGKTKKVTTNLDLLEQESEWQWHLLGYMQRLLPSTSCKVSSCGRHMGSPPIVHTRRVPPCMAQSRLGAFPR